MSTYLAGQTLRGLKEIFPSANKVMHWLADCAVARTGNPVQWRSPIGFPILQPYYLDTPTSVSAAAVWAGAARHQHEQKDPVASKEEAQERRKQNKPLRVSQSIAAIHPGSALFLSIPIFYLSFPIFYLSFTYLFLSFTYLFLSFTYLFLTFTCEPTSCSNL